MKNRTPVRISANGLFGPDVFKNSAVSLHSFAGYNLPDEAQIKKTLAKTAAPARVVLQVIVVAPPINFLR